MIIKNGGGDIIIGEILLAFFCILMGVVLVTLMLSMFLELFFSIDLKEALDKIKDWNNDKKQKKEYKEEVKKDKNRMKIRIFADSKYNEIKHIVADFHKEHEIALSLIEKTFPSPQLTNDKYINDVEKVYNDCKKKYEKLVFFMTTYPVEDSRSTEIVDNGISNLRDSYDAMKNLVSELSILLVEGEDIDIEDLKQSINDIHSYSTLTGDDYGF